MHQNSLKMLRFRLSGQFAHFNQPISNQFKNTYSIVPKPQILGLLGAIAGLSGYKDSKTRPEYYEKLKETKLFIKVMTDNEIKFVVEYNSMNSYLNNRIDSGTPNVIIKEQVLMAPNFEIGVVVDEENVLHQKIIESIKNKKSVLQIYLGKNEFPANIEFISLDDFKINQGQNIRCASIFPFDELDPQTGPGTNLKLEKMPIDFNEHFKYIYKLMAIPSKDTLVDIKIRNPESFINLDGVSYHVF